MLGRGTKLVSSLVNYQSSRGAASFKDISVAINNFKNSEVTKSYVKAALIELRPPSPTELPRAIKDGVRLFTKGNWRNITVREAWLNTLVTTEVVCWFFVGEVIGKDCHRVGLVQVNVEKSRLIKPQSYFDPDFVETIQCS